MKAIKTSVELWIGNNFCQNFSCTVLKINFYGVKSQFHLASEVGIALHL